MSITKKVNMLLASDGKKQIELLDVLGYKTPQSLNKKFTTESWHATDLVKVAEYCGAELAFILPDGTRIPIK